MEDTPAVPPNGMGAPENTSTQLLTNGVKGSAGPPALIHDIRTLEASSSTPGTMTAIRQLLWDERKGLGHKHAAQFPMIHRYIRKFKKYVTPNFNQSCFVYKSFLKEHQELGCLGVSLG